MQYSHLAEEQQKLLEAVPVKQWLALPGKTVELLLSGTLSTTEMHSVLKGCGVKNVVQAQQQQKRAIEERRAELAQEIEEERQSILSIRLRGVLSRIDASADTAALEAELTPLAAAIETAQAEVDALELEAGTFGAVFKAATVRTVRRATEGSTDLGEVDALVTRQRELPLLLASARAKLLQARVDYHSAETSILSRLAKAARAEAVAIEKAELAPVKRKVEQAWRKSEAFSGQLSGSAHLASEYRRQLDALLKEISKVRVV